MTQLSAEHEVTISSQTYVVKTLMGIRDVPELELCARAVIGAMVNDGCEKPLLMSIALKDHGMRTMRMIIEKIKELRVW